MTSARLISSIRHSERAVRRGSFLARHLRRALLLAHSPGLLLSPGGVVFPAKPDASASNALPWRPIMPIVPLCLMALWPG
jgi:hypothetical protein